MTIAVGQTGTYVQLPCNGVTTSFNFPNKIFAAGDLVVTLIDPSGNQYPFANQANVGLGLNYVVNNVDVDLGCSITMNNPPTNLWTIDIRSVVPEQQTTSIKNQGAYLPELHEEFFDRSTRMLQDLYRRSYQFGIHGPDIESAPWTALPGAAVRKGQFLAFDTSANALPTVATAPITQTLATQQVPFYGVDSGAANAYVVSSVGTVAASLTVGALLRFTALSGNTGASVLNWAGLGSQPVVGQNGVALTGGEILSTGPTWVQWTGSAWQIVGTGAQPANVRTGAEIAASVTPVNYGYASLDMRRYGYLADGTTDNATPLANAVSVVTAKGGTLQFPPGVGLFSAFPSLLGLTNIIFQGAGAANGGATFGTTLVYTGTGAGTIVNANSTTGVQFRGIQFEHNNAGFTGLYWSFRNTSGNAFMCGLFDCQVGANVGTGVTHLNLDSAQNFTAERVMFVYGNPSVKGQANGGGSFSNVIRFRDCEWYKSLAAPIVWGGESWTFEGCTFEALNSGIAGAFDGGSASNVSKSMTFIGCWFGDVTGSGGTWITYYGLGLAVLGNRFGGFATATQAVSLGGVNGVTIRGNNFDTFSAAINFAVSTNTAVSVTDNNFATVTNVFGNGANAPVDLVYAPNNPTVTPPAGCAKLSANGFRYYPDKTIEQWGTVSITVGTPATVTFATNGVAFPTACWNVVAGVAAASGTNDTVDYGAPSTTSVTFNLRGTAANTATIHWRAYGS